MMVIQETTSAWEYMLAWYNVDAQAVKNDRDFRRKCDRLLASLFRKSERTFSRMGAEYSEMPEAYLMTLATYAATRQFIRALPGDVLEAMSTDDYEPSR